MQRHRIATVFAMFTVLALSFGLSACAKKPSGKTAAEGSTLQLRYALAADNVAVVPDNAPQPLTVKIGEGKFPPAFEKALIGMPVGAAKAIQVKPEEGYGPVRKELVTRVPRTSLPFTGEIKEGMVLKIGTTPVTVVKVMEDGSLVLDRNHPLAGKHLTYKVRVLAIE